MTEENVLSVESSKNVEFMCSSVLVVDCDSTCLTIVSKMLDAFGYKGMYQRLLFSFFFFFLHVNQMKVDQIWVAHFACAVNSLITNIYAINNSKIW